MVLKDKIFATYLDAQRGLTEVEQVDERNVLLSLPLHFSANNRVELVVTQITESYYAISDMAQTIGELKNAGYGINGKLLQKIQGIGKLAKIELEGNHLVRKCSAEQLGEAIHEFAEAAKTIGDAYLTYKIKRTDSEDEELIKRVRETLHRQNYAVLEKQDVTGHIETHKVDFYIPPNGTRGLALAVLANPTHTNAQVWGFKTLDIKQEHKNIAVSFVYDSSRAKPESKVILEKVADVSIPSISIEEIGKSLARLGIRSH